MFFIILSLFYTGEYNIYCPHGTYIIQSLEMINHGYETPGQALNPNSAASCGVLYPCLCRILRPASFSALCFWNLELITLCCAGLFNLPIPLRCAFGMGVSQ